MCCSDYWTAKVGSPAVPLTISIAAGERLTNYAQVAIGHNPQSVRSMTNYIYSWDSLRIYVPECHAVARVVSHPGVLASALVFSECTATDKF